MRKILFVVCLVFCSTIFCNAQTDAVFYISVDTTVDIEVNGPVDGAYQSFYVLDKLQPTTSPMLYQINIEDYSAVRFNFDAIPYSMLVFAGDSIAIHFANNAVFPEGTLPLNAREVLFSVSGANAKGQIYLNNWDANSYFLSKLIKTIINTDDYSDFQDKFEIEFVASTRTDIEKMIQLGEVTADFGKALKREIIGGMYSNLLSTLRTTHLNKKLTDMQAAQINAIVDRLTCKFAQPEYEKASLRHMYWLLDVGGRYDYAYRKLNDIQKKELYDTNKYDSFGPHSFWLLAPTQVQLASLFSTVMCEYKYGDMGFGPINIPYVLNYMKGLAPNSEAVSILTKMEQAQSNKKIDTASIKYMDGPINSFAELMARPDLKGNYCLIDLWATWCMPCLMEHKHAEALHKAVSDFKNLKQVYITIDEPKDEKRWKATVEKFNLSGLHLMATPELQKEIQAKIFHGKDISVPQYFLLSPTGEVINPELPRPSQLKELKQALSQSVGKVS